MLGAVPERTLRAGNTGRGSYRGALPHCETLAYPPTPLTRPNPTPSNPGRWGAKLLGLLQAEVMLAAFAQLAVLLSDLLP